MSLRRFRRRLTINSTTSDPGRCHTPAIDYDGDDNNPTHVAPGIPQSMVLLDVGMQPLLELEAAVEIVVEVDDRFLLALRKK